jgi:hypothetical protein
MCLKYARLESERPFRNSFHVIREGFNIDENVSVEEHSKRPPRNDWEQCYTLDFIRKRENQCFTMYVKFVVINNIVYIVNNFTDGIHYPEMIDLYLKKSDDKQNKTHLARYFEGQKVKYYFHYVNSLYLNFRHDLL